MWDAHVLRCRTNRWQARPGAFLMRVEDIARYLVTGGRDMLVDPLGTDDGEVVAFFASSPFTALLQQRGVATLHAASVATKAGAVLLLGRSGIGKSSLAAALVERGYPLLADDVTGVTLDAGGRPVVLPAEEAPVDPVPSLPPLPFGVLGEPHLGLCEFVQRARVRLNRIAGLSEIAMRDAGCPKAPGQDGGVDRVLRRRPLGKLVEEAPCIAVSVMIEQHLDPRIRNVGYRGFRPGVAEPGEHLLCLVRIVPFGVEPDHLRREHRRGLIRLPGIPNPLKGIIETAHGAQISGILECGHGGILRMCR